MLLDEMGIAERAKHASDESFAAFADRAAAPLLRALVAVFGTDAGREAALDALAWGWEHWPRLSAMSNPVGYLYRVGLTAGRREMRRRNRDELRATLDVLAAQPDEPDDQDLRNAIERLSPRQRAAVVMVVGHSMTLREVAEILGCSISSLRNHVNRALRHLRTQLGEDDADQ